MVAGFILERGDYGPKAVVTSPWSSAIQEEIERIRPAELELNYAKGWTGNRIDFVERLGWLKAFEIIDLRIEDIGAIHHLSKLESLSITTYCKTPILFDSFPHLSDCSLEWRPKSESLFECVGLRRLFVNRYKGRSSAPFAKLVNLEALQILNSSIGELDALGSLKGLRELRLTRLGKIRSLDGIRGLGGLRRLELQSCKSVSSIAPLSQLTSLEVVLLINMGEIESLKPLASLRHLREVLFYDDTNIKDGDLSDLHKNGNIRNISFQNRRHYSHQREEFAVAQR